MSWYSDKNKLSDEGGKAIKGNLIFFTWSDDAKVNGEFDFSMVDKVYNNII